MLHALSRPEGRLFVDVTALGSLVVLGFSFFGVRDGLLTYGPRWGNTFVIRPRDDLVV